ncbi:MAG: VOC family protein [Rhodothermales bacterium]|nr:VOC family protein [Rhodothermales bacterium]
MQLHPYLAFNGTCEEAMTFYRDCFGGEFESLNRFSDGPDEMGGTTIPPDMKQKIMHLTWRFDGNVVMASDTLEDVPAGGQITLSVNMDDPDDLDARFETLAEGGTVKMPPQDTFWGSRFGMLVDRFGVHWMFNCHLEQE